MATKGDHGAAAPKAVEEPQAAGAGQGVGGAEEAGVGMMQLHKVPQWCVDTASAYSVVPGKSWGSLEDVQTRRTWSNKGCDDAFAAAGA